MRYCLMAIGLVLGASLLSAMQMGGQVVSESVRSKPTTTVTNQRYLPVKNIFVEIFQQKPDKSVGKLISKTFTNNAGVFMVDVPSAGDYFVRINQKTYYLVSVSSPTNADQTVWIDPLLWQVGEPQK